MQLQPLQLYNNADKYLNLCHQSVRNQPEHCHNYHSWWNRKTTAQTPNVDQEAGATKLSVDENEQVSIKDDTIKFPTIVRSVIRRNGH